MGKDTLVDTRVHDLADFWLSDDERTSEQAHAARVMLLAQTIQVAIEDWCDNETEDPREKGDDDGREYADPRDARQVRE